MKQPALITLARIGQRQSGVTLIEALVTLLVLTIGMVGMAALMLTSLANVQSSSHYSVGTAMSLDLEERLWFEMARTIATDLATTGEVVSLDADDLCLEDDVVEDIIDDLIDDWTTDRDPNDASWPLTHRRMRIPGITVDDNGGLIIGATQQLKVADDPDKFVRWKLLEITFDWEDVRTAEQQSSFTAEVGLLCRPEF